MDVREKLVELIEKASYECDEGARDLWDMREVADGIADFLIANGVTVQEWISVDDRLPEEKANCIVYYQHSYCDNDGYWAIGVCFYDGEKFQLNPAYKVTHWMPLPEPPKGETIYCKDCEHLMFSDCYGECANGHKGIVNPNDTCEHAKRKPPKGE